MKYGSGCKACAIYPNCTAEYRGSECAALRSEFGLGDPMTNADRIRSLSDEELAVLLAEEFSHDCYACDLDCYVSVGDKFDNCCQNAFYKWLKQPHGGAGHEQA